jgi:hypothetical protein
MKINLIDQINADINLITKEFTVNHGWHHTDAQMMTKSIEKTEVNLIMSPKILSYEEKNYQSQIWYACIFTVNDLKMKSTFEYFLRLFPALKYKPFKDEDALHQHFVPYKKEEHATTLFKRMFRSTHKRLSKSAFFINPDYPDGYWNNHTIDSIKL